MLTMNKFGGEFYFVQGTFEKQVGPFVANVPFEGVVKKVFEREDCYVIQGVKLPKTNVKISNTSLKKETIDLARLTGATEKRTYTRKKKFKVNYIAEANELVASKWEEFNDFEQLIGKMARQVDYRLRDTLKEKVDFHLAVIANADKRQDTPLIRDSLHNIHCLFETTLNELENSPKYADLMAAFTNA